METYTLGEDQRVFHQGVETGFEGLFIVATALQSGLCGVVEEIRSPDMAVVLAADSG